MRYIFILFAIQIISAQEVTHKKIQWLRTGISVGFGTQDNFIPFDSDYYYQSKSIKWTNQFSFWKKNKHHIELLIEPAYFSSEHQLFNYWTKTKYPEDREALWQRNRNFKRINEYALHLGFIYRYQYTKNLSFVSVLNTGPMYIDTTTERLVKGFAFSDVFATGVSYQLNKLFFESKFTIRHASNLNFNYPNYGLNAFGGEISVLYVL